MNQKQALKIIEITKNTYELIGGEFSNTRNRVWPEMELLVKKYVKKGNRVLDIGCGNGRLLEVLSEVDYLGVDGSNSLITEAFDKIKNQKSKIKNNESPRRRILLNHLDTKNIKSNKGIRFVALDMLELNKLEKNNFEVIFMFASFNHIPSQELRLKVLADIKKLLKPGGVLIMTNWNMWQVGVKKSIWQYKIIEPFKKIIDRDNWKLEIGNWKLWNRDVKTVWQSGDREKKGELYYRAFTKGELKKLFKKSGFKILENYYTLDGKKSGWHKGKNIVTVGRR